MSSFRGIGLINATGYSEHDKKETDSVSAAGFSFADE